MENGLFDAHTQILLESGIPSKNIIRLPEQIHIDASTDLLRQAKKCDCGTVVIGRRGREAEKGLLKRVSSKTVQQADNIAIWLIG